MPEIMTSGVGTLEMSTLGMGTLNMKTKRMWMMPHNNGYLTVDDVRGRMLGMTKSGVGVLAMGTLGRQT